MMRDHDFLEQLVADGHIRPWTKAMAIHVLDVIRDAYPDIGDVRIGVGPYGYHDFPSGTVGFTWEIDGDAHLNIQVFPDGKIESFFMPDYETVGTCYPDDNINDDNFSGVKEAVFNYRAKRTILEYKVGT